MRWLSIFFTARYYKLELIISPEVGKVRENYIIKRIKIYKTWSHGGPYIFRKWISFDEIFGGNAVRAVFPKYIL